MVVLAILVVVFKRQLILLALFFGSTKMVIVRSFRFCYALSYSHDCFLVALKKKKLNSWHQNLLHVENNNQSV